MKTLVFWMSRYRVSTHTLVGLLTAFQAAYLTDADMQHIVNRILGAHPVAHAVAGYGVLVFALYRNGTINAKK